MSAIKLLSAVYMLLVAAAVAVNSIATLFYDPKSEGVASTAWDVLNPLMVAGVVIVLLLAASAKLRRDSGSSNKAIDREYLEANVTFYFSAFLLLALLWNWISSQWVEPAGDIGLLWIFIDTTFPLLLGSTGIRLLRRDPAFDCSPKQ